MHLPTASFQVVALVALLALVASAATVPIQNFGTGEVDQDYQPPAWLILS
ncbi:hypothetical protein C8J57DRAFT_1501600 [Mycena rebaudengoi]|nr:hypothetical protein C8J57DRAFT_1501600 [Mycena rebaudengoi]